MRNWALLASLLSLLPAALCLPWCNITALMVGNMEEKSGSKSTVPSSLELRSVPENRPLHLAGRNTSLLGALTARRHPEYYDEEYDKDIIHIHHHHHMNYDETRAFQPYSCADGDNNNCEAKYCKSKTVQCLGEQTTSAPWSHCRCMPIKSRNTRARDPTVAGCDASETTNLSLHCRDEPYILYPGGGQPHITVKRSRCGTFGYEAICDNNGLKNCYCFAYE